ncbi:MAG TPA: FKBP-type peptidyl-prolyl cis-trans isomerase [Solirubrobacterales bacterium]|nr:FKBP-type peptidyl-prolyl cis-trans isomerase [Solirubrobacterales bacterium]
MKVLAAVVAAFLALGLVACGGGDDATTEDPIEAKVQEYLEGPNPEPPPGPPPKKLTVRDLKVGSGPVAKKGDKVAVHYIAEGYESGATFSRRWEPDPPVTYPRLGEGRYKELEEGIEGMREGGRREIITPDYAQFPLIYVLELEKVEPAAK